MIRLRHHIFILTFILLTGCASTELGDFFIPKHPQSEQTSGYVTNAYLVDGNDSGCKPEEVKKNPDKLAMFSAGVDSTTVANWAATQALKFLQKEVDSEAKKYEFQHSAYIRFRSCELTEKSKIIVAREKSVTGETEPRKDCKESDAACYVLGLNNRSNTEKKSLVLEFQPEKVKVNQTGAKLVSWPTWNNKTWYNTINLIAWFDGLFLEKSDEVNIKMDVEISGLIGAKDGPEQVDVLKTSIPEQAVKLGSSVSFAENTGAWIYAPAINGENSAYLTANFLITESDPSNVKKHLEQVSSDLKEKISERE